MTLFSLPNLTSQDATPFDPAGFASLPSRPSFASKDDYRSWCIRGTTNHAFLSVFSGMTETRRVNEHNVPLKMHGFIADFDSGFNGNIEQQIIDVCPPEARPMYVSRSFSGGIRAYWLFEMPVVFGQEKLVNKFLARLIKGLKPAKVFPGFDSDAAHRWVTYYEPGHDWQAVPNSVPLSVGQLEAWMFDAVAGLKDSTKGKLLASFDDVRKELEKKFPGAWPGGWDRFEPGARGARFWDQGNANACIVREDGITCFTGDSPFVSWADLLGKAWVDKNIESRTGDVIASLYFEPTANRYWRKTAGNWQPLVKEDLKLHLRINGVADDRARGALASPVDIMLHQVQTSHAVSGVFPFHYNSKELVSVNGSPFLNTSRAKLAMPDLSRKGRWAEGFPTIAEYYEGLYDVNHNTRQFACAMAELSHFYTTAFEGDLQRGRIMVHAGPVSVGKTFNLNLLGMIFGATEDAARYLFGHDGFNASLVTAPIWAVDDPVAATDGKTHLVFSSMLKSIAACDNIPVRGMYRESLRLPWLGRVWVNMNDDPESIRMLPSTEINLMDKVSLFLVKRPFGGQFPSDSAIRAEIPAFCQFLLEGRQFLMNLINDDELFGDPRWGVTKYHHPKLVAVAQSAQSSTSVEELLVLWRRAYFELSDQDFWTGNPTDLLEQMAAFDNIRDIYKSILHGANGLSRGLAQLSLRENPPGWLRRMGEHREYRIYRDNDGALKDREPDPY